MSLCVAAAGDITLNSLSTALPLSSQGDLPCCFPRDYIRNLSIETKKILIVFVKQGEGVMSTEMWGGVVHPCKLPAQDVPGAGCPGYPSCCVSTQSHLWAGSPVTRPWLLP